MPRQFLITYPLPIEGKDNLAIACNILRATECLQRDWRERIIAIRRILLLNGLEEGWDVQAILVKSDKQLRMRHL